MARATALRKPVKVYGPQGVSAGSALKKPSSAEVPYALTYLSAEGTETIFLASKEAESTQEAFSNYRNLIDRVVDVFGDEITASKWLSSPSADFNQKTPLEVARANGYRSAALDPVLVRIEHGVYF